MNPYVAIIKDSFREAFASRVLPFLVLLFTAVLAALAPLGFRETTSEGRAGLKITYAGSSDWAVLDPIQQYVSEDPELVRTNTEAFLAGICMYLLGKVGVFVAILVSAGVIPRMMEPGSIDLLLSKPVSRTGLFLTKFASGCAFILINVAYFMIGLWLIAGLRLGIWTSKLLLTIPVFLFVFSIIYSFSAVAAILWRNPIVSVMFAMVLWALCITFGQYHDYGRHQRNLESAAVVIGAGDNLLISERSGATRIWDQQKGDWEEVFEGAPQFRSTLNFFDLLNTSLSVPLIGPVYDGVHQRIAAIQMSPPTFRGDQRATAIVFGTHAGNWRVESTIAPPPDATTIFFDRSGSLLAAGRQGVYRLGNDPTSTAAGEQTPRPRPGFEKIAPGETTTWHDPFAAAIDHANDQLVVLDAGTLRKYALSEGRYHQVAERQLDAREPALVAAADRAVAIASLGGGVEILDGDTLARIEKYSVSDPEAVVVSPDGRWIAIVTHRRRLWLFDARERTEATAAVPGQGAITAAGFDEQSRLLVSDRVNRVTRYTLGEFQRESQVSPPETGWSIVYRWIVTPLYTVFPKPGDLDLTVQYLFTDQRTEVLPGASQSLNARRIVHDVWTPVWSNLATLAVILGLTCWYFSRRDF